MNIVDFRISGEIDNMYMFSKDNKQIFYSKKMCFQFFLIFEI